MGSISGGRCARRFQAQDRRQFPLPGAKRRRPGKNRRLRNRSLQSKPLFPRNFNAVPGWRGGCFDGPNILRRTRCSSCFRSRMQAAPFTFATPGPSPSAGADAHADTSGLFGATGLAGLGSAPAADSARGGEGDAASAALSPTLFAQLLAGALAGPPAAPAQQPTQLPPPSAQPTVRRRPTPSRQVRPPRRRASLRKLPSPRRPAHRPLRPSRFPPRRVRSWPRTGRCTGPRSCPPRRPRPRHLRLRPPRPSASPWWRPSRRLRRCWRACWPRRRLPRRRPHRA